MSFETDLVALVAPLFNGRFYWDTTPDNFANRDAPFCIAQQVGGIDAWYVDNALPEHSNARMQFWIGGARRIEVSEAARDLRKLLADSNSNGVFITRPEGAPVGDYDEVLKIRGSRTDFSFWYKDPRAV